MERKERREALKNVDSYCEFIKTILGSLIILSSEEQGELILEFAFKNQEIKEENKKLLRRWKISEECVSAQKEKYSDLNKKLKRIIVQFDEPTKKSCLEMLEYGKLLYGFL
ncbi:MAG: hypothetical protein PHI91_02665 [Candidatus Pacebacteria bacterium]|nr:hypothetical protein [Candidatus Paceibacterota bacterium]MDD2757410.1 hypothetical protein [Candidatus Paceibacterota bacterium]MDD3970068.1 hypothetical protein [Candidatus Paceibacterota bacterium]